MQLTFDKITQLLPAGKLHEAISVCQYEQVDFTATLTTEGEAVKCEMITGIGGWVDQVPTTDIPSAMVVATKSGKVVIHGTKDRYEILGLSPTQQGMLRPRQSLVQQKPVYAQKPRKPKASPRRSQRDEYEEVL